MLTTCPTYCERTGPSGAGGADLGVERSAHSAKENVAAAPGAAGQRCDATPSGREPVRAALTLHRCWSRPPERSVLARRSLQRTLDALSKQ